MTRPPTSVHDWFDLVEKSGLVLGEPVLHVAFPGGPERVSPRLQRALLAAWQRLQVAPEDAARRTRWFDFLFHELFAWPREALRRASDLPSDATVRLDDVDDTIAPSALLVDSTGAWDLAVFLLPADHPFDRVERTPGRWRATPQARAERWLRAANRPLALLANGSRLRLIHVPPGLPAGWIEVDLPSLVDEKGLLDGIVTLLGAARFSGEMSRRLAHLVVESQERQAELTDTLGLQVRDAVEKLLLALDRADEASGGRLFDGLTDEEIYRLAVFVVMRLVFLLFAEERSLLPHGNLFYDDAYGLGRLIHRLEEERRERPERFAAERDAWPRLLALFRLVFSGSSHPDLPLPAYGGDLFDPQAFRAMGVLERPDLALPNESVAQILRALTFGAAKVGRETILQRYSYRTLDVEHIGYLYEGLLDHRAARAGAEPLVKLRNGTEEAWPLGELERRSADERVRFLAEQKVLGGSEDRIRARLSETEEPLPAELAALPAELAERCRPFAGVIQCNEVVRPGRLYLTTSASRRSTGTHYTPIEYTRAMVEETLAPLVHVAADPALAGPRPIRPPRELLALRICDPAMGSGAFLVQAVRYLAGRLVDAWWAERDRVGEGPAAPLLYLPYAEPGNPREDRIPVPTERDEAELWARRIVAERCVYGVDKNPLATEMAKLSLWLVTLSRDKPFSFVDHALRSGDSLLGLGNLDQLRTWSLDGRGTENLASREAVAESTDLRRQIQDLPVATPEDVAWKAGLNAQASEATATLRALGDLFFAAVLSEPAPRKQAAHLAATLLAQLDRVDDARHLREAAAPELAGHTPFHWPLEFPEVFERENPGFDAIVGNPPYMGGQKLTGALGTSYREYLVAGLARGARGSADLVAYFFLRAFALLRDGGNFGLLAINTIAEGDTRQVGLEQLLGAGGEIYSTHPNEPWPGAAAVVTTRVHLHKGPWGGARAILGKAVPRISPFLTGREEWTPKQLKANEGIAFQGSIILGLGFTMTEQEALAILEKDERYCDVLFPYLNGKDLNSHPEQKPSRWVINFWDWPEERARDFPLVFRIVEEKVKPERMLQGDLGAQRLWWLHLRPRPELYHKIGRGELFEKHPAGWRDFATSSIEVLVCSEVSKHLIFMRVPNRPIFSANLDVFAPLIFEMDVVLHSNIHEIWGRQYSAKLETRLKYSPGNAFGTFPMPDGSVLHERNLGATQSVHTSQITREASIGLTDLYNRLHDPAHLDSRLQRLRELQVEVDRAVADAYGWNDLDLGHDFHEVPYLPEGDRTRFTVSEEARHAILDRLSELNRQRYDEEVKQGLHAGGRPSRSTADLGKAAPIANRAPRRARPTQPTPQGTLFADEEAPPPLQRVADAPDPSLPRPAASILLWLEQSPGWHGKAEILAGSGVDAEDWKKAIDELVDGRRVEREGERRGARYRGKPDQPPENRVSK